MLIHYIKIALRNMGKQKGFALINVGGFAIGIAACLLIALYIRHETSYDSHVAEANRVFRLIGEARQNGIRHSGVSFQAPMAKALITDFPQIESAARLMSNALLGGASNQVRLPQSASGNYEEGFCLADSSLLPMLDVKMLYGNRATALAMPNSVVLCKSLADKYFPRQNPVGKLLIFNNNEKAPLMVTGVMQDFPATSHLQYRGFISLAGISFWPGEQDTWLASNYSIYLKLKPGVNIKSFEQNITRDVLDNYMKPAMKAAGVPNVEAALQGASLYLQPLTDIHLHSYDIEEQEAQRGDIRFVWLFAAIAVVVLLLACINFINLATARSANRAREVGVRKVMGSSRRQLISQFLAESMLYSFLSVAIALLLVALLLPFFNSVAGTELSLPLRQWWLAPLLVLFAFIIGLIAGLYPAFYLSYFRPVQTLKGNISLGSRNAGLRSSLVVFQFTVSVVLLIGTCVVYRQMQYILNSKIGFNKDQVVMLQGTDALRNQTATFANRLLQLPLVKNVTVSDYLPVSGTKRNGNPFWVQGTQSEENRISGQRWVIDENYLATLGIKLMAGRNFSPQMPTDSSAAIINKAMADKLGLANPIGETITSGSNQFSIIGVVDNFYFESVKQEVRPLCMVLGNSNSIIAVKLSGSEMKTALKAVEDTWKHFLPHNTMRYRFLDESYAAMYADVQRMQYIFTGFSLLAVVIACLGLFALSAFMAEQRSKEISIRKVLGASVGNVVSLLSANFLKLICLSLCIAVPLGWLLMHQWLQDYAYRISITWDVFALAAATILCIALFTVSFQAVKAALANPVDTLRSE